MARTTLAVLLIVLLTDGQSIFAQAAQQPAAEQPAAGQPAPAAAPLPPEQLDSLVAPIALYPDPLLSQTLVASTYPLEMVQLQQWLEKHKDLKDAALTEAVKKEDWDPSIQAMAALPDVVKLLSENITWTTDLGNAFLAQQADVMAAVQRMRKKAEDTGNLKTTEQQKVETKVVEQKQVIVVEQANPEVIYVPTYSPTVVYGPPPVVYAYPPIAYPPYTGVGVAFTAGIIMGAAFSGGWGYNCGWGSSNVNINVNNNFVKNSNVNRNQINNGGRGGNNSWQHNPQHRGAAPYGDRSTASKYGGTTRGDSAATREANTRQQQSQRTPSAGTSDRSGSANRGAAGADRSAGAADRSAGGADRSAGGADRSAAGADRGASAGDRSSSGGGGGGDRVGNRSVPSSSSSGSGGAFGGSGSHGSSARASSQRGGSSMSGGGRSGGGGRRR